ncbi:PDZ domain-containing protein [Dysgonomonas sp. 520]|uniref:PDZ domain-containing protein n=1 Tax=Dysgonomonas sp. 520 TaxID=2302931 RepID=UPI0013D8C977|nr:PDZ domain-containing protein [Dysgonomonas sp. 520]NDW10400.1 DUF4136 domain-containing protein [Dysgonomonas sp. 520]
MKQLSLVLILLITSLCVKAQTNNRACHFGLTFEISNNTCWGYGEPVVTSVEPFSAADKAGIKVGDIIMEIDGEATYLRSYNLIASKFFDNTSAETTFTIRNLTNYFTPYTLRRECNAMASLSESELATSFSFYSLENTNDRKFVMPLQILTNNDVDYSDYHTFDFLREPDAPAIDGQISAIIEQCLVEKGLTRNTKDPDFIVQTYYSYQPNARFNAAAKPTSALSSWRYDPTRKIMIKLPIIPGDAPNAAINGQFVLELGIRFFDKKYIDSKNLTQIWDCHSTEYLSDKYQLEEYTRVHTPLMLMTFPYSTNKTTVDFVVKYKKHNYTGIHISSDNMRTITDVDENSPAYFAGVRGGDVLQKIGNYKFNVSKDELTNAYKRFLVETMVYRDPVTRFTDANGFPDCMFWDKYQYGEIAKEFKKNFYMTHFSYLYNFERYISPTSSNKLSFEVATRGQKRTFNVTPEIRSSVRVEIK